MCRNITRLRHPERPAARDEAEAAAIQYVRKVSGYRRPSRANQAVFDAAVARIADATEEMLSSLVVRRPAGAEHPQAATGRPHPSISVVPGR